MALSVSTTIPSAFDKKLVNFGLMFTQTSKIKIKVRFAWCCRNCDFCSLLYDDLLICRNDGQSASRDTEATHIAAKW